MRGEVVDHSGECIRGWFVVGRCGTDHRNRSLWFCVCQSCGDEKLVPGHYLNAAKVGRCNRCNLPPNVKDITGQRFGRWTVISFVKVRKYHADNGACSGGVALWRCVCNCGVVRVCLGSHLRGGRSKSCGCDKESMRRAARDRRIKGRLVNDVVSFEYRAWRSMKDRCVNPKSRAYHNYGGRGISVCDRWLGVGGFQAFYEDMGPKPSNDLTLERVDNDGNYTPDNCVWASWKDQARNQRTNRLLTYNGETKCVSEWAEETGLSYSCIWQRVDNGWPVHTALTTPSRSENIK